MGTKKLKGGRPRVNVLAKEFQEGYMKGCDDPGFLTATVPDAIPRIEQPRSSGH